MNVHVIKYFQFFHYLSLGILGMLMLVANMNYQSEAEEWKCRIIQLVA
jgi:hypothetical protein